MEHTSKIFVAGHRGLAGSALVRRLGAAGFSNLVLPTHSELDLADPAEVDGFFSRELPDYVFLAAAKVGGILANKTYPADFILNNLKIQNNVVEASWRYRAKGLLFLGSSCIYPRLAPQPLKVEYLLSGPLEPTNEPYAVAKIAGIKLCESFNRQYGTRFLSVMPTNLYGPNDNYDLLSSHVLPALIRKFHLAMLASIGEWEKIKRDEATFGTIPDDFKSHLNSIAEAHGHHPALDAPQFTRLGSSLTLWGTGSPKRELLYSDGLADACIFLMRRLDVLFSSRDWTDGPVRYLINIGSGAELAIRELAKLVSTTVQFQGGIQWDHAKPDGTPRKLLDTSPLMGMGWKPAVSLETGIRLAYQDYLRRGCNSASPSMEMDLPMRGFDLRTHSEKMTIVL